MGPTCQRQRARETARRGPARNNWAELGCCWAEGGCEADEAGNTRASNGLWPTGRASWAGLQAKKDQGPFLDF